MLWKIIIYFEVMGNSPLHIRITDQKVIEIIEPKLEDVFNRVSYNSLTIPAKIWIIQGRIGWKKQIS